jgi:hypothetical protein
MGGLRKIASCQGGCSPENRISFYLFEPFNFFFFEKEQTIQCQTNQRLMKNLPERSISGLSDGLLFRL